MILVDSAGKSAAAKTARELVSAGVAVLCIDPRGVGETKPPVDLNDSEFYRYFGDYENAMTALLLRRSMVAMRALDIVRGIEVLSSRPDIVVHLLLDLASVRRQCRSYTRRCLNRVFVVGL